MTVVLQFIDSLSAWERAGVRDEATGNGVFLLLPSALTLTLSQSEREQSK
jgi:hypothetical protein